MPLGQKFRCCSHESKILARGMRSQDAQADKIILPKAIGELPTGHLQLPQRVAWSADEFRTIGELIEGFIRNRPLETRSLTSQLTRVVRNLVSAVRTDGLHGWDRFRKARPLFVTHGSLYFFSPAFERLGAATVSDRLAKLHLSRRAINALHAANVTTIGDLIQRTKTGITDLSASGELTSTEIVESLDALADAVASDGSVDWVCYAERRRFQLLPNAPQDAFTGRQFLWQFPRACDEAVTSKFGSAGALILRNRLFRHRDILVPLPEVGRHLGVSGERCRLIETSVLKMLRDAILREEYCGCRFRFRREFLRPLHELAEMIQRLPPGRLSLDQWRLTLMQCWGAQPEDLGQQEMIILQLLGIESYPEEAACGTSAGEEFGMSAEIVSEIQRLFSRSPALSFTREDIRQHLFAKFREAAPEGTNLAQVLEQLPTLEFDRASGRYRLRLEHVKNTVDRCERILRDSGFPMHYGELTAEIDRLLPEGVERPAERSVAMRLAGSKRFIAIARTGHWALREWGHVETRSVAEIAADLLRKSASPLTEDELFHSIVALRPTKRGSIGSLLREDGRFRRVAPVTWELAATPEEQAEKSGGST